MARWLMRTLVLAADNGFKLNTNSNNKFTPPPKELLICFPPCCSIPPSFLYLPSLQSSNRDVSSDVASPNNHHSAAHLRYDDGGYN